MGGVQLERNWAHGSLCCEVPQPKREAADLDGGAAYARWRGDSPELFYYAADGRIMVVPISGTTTLEVGTPVPLFNARLLGGPAMVTGFRVEDHVAADGKRFLLNVPTDSDTGFPCDHGGPQLDGGAQEVEFKALDGASSLCTESDR